MLYIIVLIMILYCICKYDICGHKQYKKTWFYFLLFLFIIIAGFSYRLGGDNISYIKEFPMYRMNSGYSWAELTNYSGRQPLWVLMSKLCKSVINEYWFFRFIHSLLLNSLFFFAFRKITKYLFTTILFYFVLVYFEFNFQVMRQAISVGLFLMSVSQYKRNNWVSYYLINLLAILFHETAIITYLLPLIRRISISSKSLIIFFIISIVVALLGPLMVETLLPFFMDSIVADKAFFYFSKIDNDNSVLLIPNILLNIIIPYFFVYKKHIKDSTDISDYFVIVYGVLYGLGLNVPIIYRLNQYFLIFYFICYIEIFIQLSIWLRRKFGLNMRKIYMCMCLFFLMYRARMYFMPYADTNIPSYVQFYPYYSIFFENVDPIRENLYKIM